MKTISMVLIFVLAIAAAAGLYAWRGSRLELQAVSADQTTLSNRLNEVAAKVTERDAANETLQVKLKLQAEDAAALSNRVHEARAGLTDALERAGQEVATVRSRDAEIVRLQSELSGSRQSATRLKEEIESLRNELSDAMSHLTLARRQVGELAESRNASETERARLLRQWNDPSLVRARCLSLRESSRSAGGSHLPANRPLVIQPDGSVVADFAPEIE